LDDLEISKDGAGIAGDFQVISSQWFKGSVQCPHVSAGAGSMSLLSLGGSNHADRL
jgi:hypothetical protein